LTAEALRAVTPFFEHQYEEALAVRAASRLAVRYLIVLEKFHESPLIE